MNRTHVAVGVVRGGGAHVAHVARTHELLGLQRLGPLLQARRVEELAAVRHAALPQQRRRFFTSGNLQIQIFINSCKHKKLFSYKIYKNNKKSSSLSSPQACPFYPRIYLAPLPILISDWFLFL